MPPLAHCFFAIARKQVPNILLMAGVAMLAGVSFVPTLSAQTTLYWDINGATSGAGGSTPDGGWKSSGAAYQNWSTSSAGTAATANWTDGSIAVFSAGSNATGSFEVTVRGAPTADSVVIQEGNITFTGSSLTLSGSTPSVNVASGSTATFNTKFTGSSDLVKTGAGTLVLNSLSNNYTGATTVNAGTLQIGSGNNILPNTTDLTIANGASVMFANGSDTEIINSLSGAGSLNFGDNALKLNGSGSTTFSGVIADSGGTLRQQGGGTITLSGNNTFTGNIYLNNGIIIAASDHALGAASAGNVVSSNAALQFTGGVTVNETDIAIKATGTDGTGALRSLAGNNTFNAAIKLDGNTTVSSDAGTFTLGGNFTQGSYNLNIDGAGNTTLSGALAGGGAAQLIKDGSGTLKLSGSSANTFGGSVSINNGVLQLGKTAGTDALGGGDVTLGDGIGSGGSAAIQLLANNQIANSTSSLTIASDGKLDLNNFSESLDSLISTGLIATGGSGYLGIGLNGGNSDLGGTITGSGTLAQLGAGTLTLGNSIDFSSGTLVLSGGTLDLNGFDLMVNTLHITADSIIDFVGASQSSSLFATNFIIDAGFTLSAINWVDGTDHFNASSWFGATQDLTGSAPMNQVVFSGFSSSDTKWQSYDNQITPIPEPSDYGALLIAAILALWVYRQHRSRDVSSQTD